MIFGQLIFTRRKLSLDTRHTGQYRNAILCGRVKFSLFFFAPAREHVFTKSVGGAPGVIK
jgi:hypothetical protein